MSLNAALDGVLESCLQERRTVADTLRLVLPVLVEKTGARGAFVRTFGDDLALASTAWPEGLEIPGLEEVISRTTAEKREELALSGPKGLVVARPLDVAGEWFGHAGLVVDGPAREDPRRLHDLLATFCEQIDNLLFVVRAAREKHRLTMQLGDALRHRVLAEGLRQAVRVLSVAVPLRRLLLVCVAEEGRSSSLHVQVFEQGAVMVDTMGSQPRHPEEPAILNEARAYLERGDGALLRRFGFEGAHEDVLINGITPSSVVGKLVAAARGDVFNTQDRELLAVFASYIRQRVVDFNKEWRTLAVSFPPRDVSRLLQVDHYVRRYLEPREAEVAILYADIAGFTRISEQVLRSPARVAQLVEVWSRDAVDLVWEHGGVFDKMVGDCVIAHFGPPFYERRPGERLADALRCARVIRDMTRRLPERPGLELLAGTEVGVATGVNLCPLFVGRFGPNDNFTGFSRGMNNAARLQGCATRDEILVMAEAIPALGTDPAFKFGPERSAKVKNVAEPLRFRALLD
ncbi:MAG TPA: adenylate/guanylate cyclase domain-containing protein [Vicinamibacteria bacterium]|nr:adenylate/guanylate cyclase domain-containing protein [Vicinamibacteria bacterium]